MPLFKFRFQQVLDFKQREEENCRLAFWEARHALQEAEAYLTGLIEKYERVVAELITRRNASMRVAEIKIYQAYQQGLLDEIARQRTEVARRAEATERQRKKMLAAVKERKVMERLRERHLQEYLEHAKKDEQNLMDELARNVAIK